MSNSQFRFYEHDRLASIVAPASSVRLVNAAGTPVCQLGKASFTETILFAIDRVNSVLASTQGSATKTMTYCAYGNTPIGSLPVAIGFNGEHLEAFGVFFLGRGERGYSPHLRRFISADRASIFLAGNLNAYAYTAGDPINRLDPSGNTWEWVKRPLRSLGVMSPAGTRQYKENLSSQKIHTKILKETPKFLEPFHEEREKNLKILENLGHINEPADLYSLHSKATHQNGEPMHFTSMDDHRNNKLQSMYFNLADQDAIHSAHAKVKSAEGTILSNKFVNIFREQNISKWNEEIRKYESHNPKWVKKS